MKWICCEKKCVKFTIETASIDGKVEQVAVGLVGWLEDKDARVEAVWPADVGDGRELFALEELVDVLDDEAVGVKEHALGEVDKTPAVQLGEGDAELGSS